MLRISADFAVDGLPPGKRNVGGEKPNASSKYVGVCILSKLAVISHIRILKNLWK